MKNILNVCLKVREITDEELAEAEAMAREQIDYFSPLKMATTAKQVALGKHNMACIAALRILRNVIRDGEKVATDVS
jgi:hypothetical protein